MTTDTLVQIATTSAFVTHNILGGLLFRWEQNSLYFLAGIIVLFLVLKFFMKHD